MKRSKPHAFASQFLVHALVALCVGGSFGMGTVWLRHQISVTAQDIKRNEHRVTEIERRIAEMNSTVAAQQGTDTLQERNDAMQLGLVLPREAQVVRVTDDVQRRLVAKRAADAASTSIEAPLLSLDTARQLSPASPASTQPAPGAAQRGVNPMFAVYNFRGEGGR